VAGLLGLLAAFLLFQLFVSPIATVVLLFAKGVDLSALSGPNAIAELLEENIRPLIIGNSVGQIIGLAVVALLLTRLHTSDLWRYLRVRRTDGVLLGLALVGLVALTPVVQWLGTVNQSIPLPEFIRTLEQSQMELIQKVLSGGLGVTFNIIMLAVVPAVCEELLFRGYAQRQFERGVGVAGGVLCSGIIFGLYHLRLSQALPLSALGIYLAYLTWRTGSLWPAVLIHFANNAFSVLAANYAAQQPDLDAQALETMQVPWYILIPSAVAFCGVMYLLHRYATARLNKPARSSASNSPGVNAPPDPFS
jgi:membrane protease YdiL (CAAX protease family)